MIFEVLIWRTAIIRVMKSSIVFHVLTLRLTLPTSGKQFISPSSIMPGISKTYLDNARTKTPQVLRTNSSRPTDFLQLKWVVLHRALSARLTMGKVSSVECARLFDCVPRIFEEASSGLADECF